MPRFQDWVDVYDGANETSDKLGSFCGYYPSQISSSGNTLLLVFHTDESNPPLPDTEPKPTGYRIIADIGKSLDNFVKQYKETNIFNVNLELVAYEIFMIILQPQ